MNINNSLAPGAVRSVVAELGWLCNGLSVEPYMERVAESDGYALAGAIAGRRAYQRAGSLWPVVDQLIRFFVGVGDHSSAERARAVVMDIREGRLDLSEDTGNLDRARTNLQSELTRMLDDLNLPADVACLLHIADLACWSWLDSKGYSSNSELSTARICFEIAWELAGGVSESAAREFITCVETLCAEVRT